MEIRTYRSMLAEAAGAWGKLMEASDISPDRLPDYTVMIMDGSTVIASGSRISNTFQYLAVDQDHRGEDLTAKIMTELVKDAFKQDIRHIFLYTKPSNLSKFKGLLFYPIASTGDVLLMENIRDGAKNFVKELAEGACSGKAECKEPAGAIVMNADPFTRGHRYLVEKALESSQNLYVFVVSEDKGMFSADDRLRMVKAGTNDLKGVKVLPTGPYLISQATFPTYFIKEEKKEGDKLIDIKCGLDVEIFYSYYVPAFNIGYRYVGTEPLDPVTRAYNKALKENLIPRGVEVITLERKKEGSVPISASRVRYLIRQGRLEETNSLLPASTFGYLKEIEENKIGKR